MEGDSVASRQCLCTRQKVKNAEEALSRGSLIKAMGRCKLGKVQGVWGPRPRRECNAS